MNQNRMVDAAIAARHVIIAHLGHAFCGSGAGGSGARGIVQISHVVLVANHLRAQESCTSAMSPLHEHGSCPSYSPANRSRHHFFLYITDMFIPR